MSFEYHEPTSLAEAVDLGARFGADGRFLAGGTDLIIQIRRGKLRLRHVVGLHRVPGLDGIDANGSVTLGALVTHRALERHSAFQGRLRARVVGATRSGTSAPWAATSSTPHPPPM
jgi:carbon-monoxide dehydrogenase medium subunit